MQLIADLHLHSRYARATSKEMEISKLAEYAKIKGLNLLGTGDFTFSEQLKDIKSKLVPIEGTGLYTYDDIFFMLTTEMATFYFEGNKSRRVHHLVHAPDIDTVEQIIDVLTKRGANTGIDGRLMIKASSPEIVELLKQINKDIHIVPAHIWTPYFGCLGSATGFDSIEDCYKDMAKYIYAVETGLSSDPPMNWRLSSLDKFALMSNSDSHSPWPWRLGREANVFDLEKPSYWELWDAVKKKDKKKFLYTIEVDPNYGKYHYTGHRDCKVVFSPKEALRIKNTCPVCRKKLTVGVLQRVEELADREEGFVPKDAIPYKSLLPLYEIISFALKEKKLNSKKILEEQNKLIKNFGNELNVIINVSFEELTKVTNEIIARAIIDVREGRIKYIPGYDGVYGEPVFGEKQTIKKLPQKNLFDY